MLNTILSIIGGLCIALVIWAFIKFKGLRIFIGVAVLAVLVFTGFMSGVRLNQYYNTSGGIIGQITGVYKKNEVSTSELEDLTFEIKNVNLSKNSDDKYSLEIQSDKILKLDENEFYTVKVNGEPCQILFSSKDSVKANYTYLFQNKNLIGDTYEEIAVDTMTINFAFYGNYSKLIIEIDGGADTSPLWESYFEKNSFKITIEKVPEIEIVTANLKTITLVANDEIYSKVKLKAGSDYVLPTTINLDGYILNYFELNGKRVEILTNVNSDILVIANLTKKCVVTVSANIDEQDYNSNFFGRYDFPAGTKISEATEILKNDKIFNYYIEEKTPTGYTFIGFKTTAGFSTDSSEIESTYVINSDTTLYVVYRANGYALNIVSNGCTFQFGELTKSSDFETMSPYNYELSLNFVDSNLEGKIFSYYKLYFSNYPDKTTTNDESNITFSIKSAFEKLFRWWEPNEYVPPEERIEFEAVGNLVVEIITREKSYEQDLWKEDFTAEELAEIAELEANIAKLFGIYYSEDGTNLPDYPIEETKFLNDLYKGITKDMTEKTNFEIKYTLLNLFNVQITEEPAFIEFLNLFYETCLNYGKK